MRILLVDDEYEIRQTFREWLAEAFPNAAFAEGTSHDEVPGLGKEFQPTVVLLDIIMESESDLAEVGSIEALKRLNPAPKVILVTGLAKGLAEDSLDSYLEIADGVLRKPVSKQELLAIIQKVAPPHN